MLKTWCSFERFFLFLTRELYFVCIDACRSQPGPSATAASVSKPPDIRAPPSGGHYRRRFSTSSTTTGGIDQSQVFLHLLLPASLQPASSILSSLYPTRRRSAQPSTNTYSKLRVIRIHWDLKKFGLRGKKCIGFGQFDQKICLDLSNYADFDFAVFNSVLPLLLWYFHF